ncbi:MAG: agmatinase [Ectothiorhodospiraceae bacterium]|nr:agmatinase [Ectothiorhodospiraceae bacterium]
MANPEPLPIEENFLGLEPGNSSYSNSKIVILTAPYERTVSYGEGTGGGPAAILRGSQYVEFWDEEFHRELCFEKGIVSLRPLSFENLNDEASLALIERSVGEYLDDEKFVVTLGGEHTISAAPIRAHLKKYPSMSVLQFDAHADLRDSYQGSKLSHASVMARVLDDIPGSRIVQCGIRALCKEEVESMRTNGVHTHYAHALHSTEQWEDLILPNLADEVYITFDVDYFDPAIMGSTGTPEPNGLFWAETIKLLKAIGKQRRIVGFDVVELAPREHAHGESYLVSKLVYKLLNIAFTGR